MGGIKVVTPASSVKTKGTILRLKKIPTKKVVSKFGFTILNHFDKDENAQGLKNTFIGDIFNSGHTRIDIKMKDFSWPYTKFSNKKAKGYGGFMEIFFTNSEFKTSKIFPLPFVNNPPSAYDIICTVLVESAHESKKDNKNRITFVTFGQPLY